MKEHSLSKKERIKSTKEFEMVFSQGKTIYSKSGKFKAVFTQTVRKDSSVKIAVGVSRKAGNAVWRNRVKRLLRESYRSIKTELTSRISSDSRTLLIFFTTSRLNQKKNRLLYLNDFLPEVSDLLYQIIKTIKPNENLEKSVE